MINFIINFTLCSGVLLLFYKLFLEKEKMHHFNRFYLIGSIVASIIIPNIDIDLEQKPIVNYENVANQSVMQIIDYKLVASKGVDGFQAENSFEINWFLVIYGIVAAFFLARFFVNIFKIYQKINGNIKLKYGKIDLVLIKENLVPHSFLNYVFLNKLEYEKGEIHESILVHEQTHIAQKHSYDILFIELVKCIFWFNFLLVFYKRAIQLNHEFLADDGALKNAESVMSYQYLLLQKSTESQGQFPSSNFNFSTTKARLIMMTKVASKRIIRAKQLAIIPIFALTILFFRKNMVAQVPSISIPLTDKVEKNTSKNLKKEVPFTIEGVSQAELDDFHNTGMKYVKIVENGKKHVMVKMPESELSRLEIIYKNMSKEQQDNQEFRFSPPIGPLERRVPTPSVLESFKNSRKYGIWIDDKRVANEELNKYKNIDFAEYDISKLEKNAMNYGKHYYQVDLMTNLYYQKYINETKVDTRKYFSWNWKKNYPHKRAFEIN